MRLGRGGDNSVQVYVPGFHPIITFRLWFRGWRLLRRMNRDPEFAEQMVKWFREQGYDVTDSREKT